ncbi:HAD family hydrolase [candidate division KSB1 bacterium]|nr:HAD family hydrolase [candidate division KSB1 bacterium]
MNLDEEKIYSGFKEVFKKRGSLEYSFSIQELPFIEKFTKEQIEKLVALGQRVFSMVRSKNLIPYPEVQQTLQYLFNHGVLIIGMTNAPIYHGEARLKQLHIDKYFYGIGGWAGHPIPNDKYTIDISTKAAKGGYHSPSITKRWSFPKDELKPNPFAYLTIINELKASHKETYVIGDSVGKDVVPAKEIGAIAIWAEYGTKYEKKNFNTLLKITHWDSKKIKSTYKEKSIEPDFTVDSFSQLKSIIDPPQLRLFE